MKKVFISYSHDDIKDKQNLLNYIVTLIRDKSIEVWEDSGIQIGVKWSKEIKDKLTNSDIVILLVSQSFIASNYINDVEMVEALGKVSAGTGKIFPILLSDCDWKNWSVIPSNDKDGIAMSAYQFAPLDEYLRLKPVDEWTHKSKAWTQIAKKIRNAVKDNATAASPTPSPKTTKTESENLVLDPSDLLKDGKTGEAIQRLLKLTEGKKDFHNEMILISGRYQGGKRQFDNGHSTKEEWQVYCGRINSTLLNLILRLGEE